MLNKKFKFESKFIDRKYHRVYKNDYYQFLQNN